MFLEMSCQSISRLNEIEFQYPLWIDVFGNNYKLIQEVLCDLRFSILFGSMFLEISSNFSDCTLCSVVSVSSLDRCFWKYEGLI